MHVTLVQCSPGLMKKTSVSDWHKRFKQSSHVEITNEESAHHFLRYQGYCSLWMHFKDQTVNRAPYVEILKRLREAVRSKRHNLVLTFGFRSSQGAHWNGTLTLFPWFDSEWFLALSKNKVYLMGLRFQGNWRYQKKKCNDTEGYSTTGVPKMLQTAAASLG